MLDTTRNKMSTEPILYCKFPRKKGQKQHLPLSGAGARELSPQDGRKNENLSAWNGASLFPRTEISVHLRNEHTRAMQACLLATKSAISMGSELLLHCLLAQQTSCQRWKDVYIWAATTRSLLTMLINLCRRMSLFISNHTWQKYFSGALFSFCAFLWGV